MSPMSPVNGKPKDSFKVQNQSGATYYCTTQFHANIFRGRIPLSKIYKEIVKADGLKEWQEVL